MKRPPLTFYHSAPLVLDSTCLFGTWHAKRIVWPHHLDCNIKYRGGGGGEETKFLHNPSTGYFSL